MGLDIFRCRGAGLNIFRCRGTELDNIRLEQGAGRLAAPLHHPPLFPARWRLGFQVYG